MCDGREDLVRELEVVGILLGANRIQIITMDYPKDIFLADIGNFMNSQVV